MSIFQVTGATGSGKTFFMLQYACELANTYRKALRANFSLDLRELRKYCGMRGFDWLAHCIDRGEVTCVDFRTDPNLFYALLEQPNTVVLLDEAQTCFPARGWQSDLKKKLIFLNGLQQHRKGGIELIWTAPIENQCDSQFVDMAHTIIQARGVSTKSVVTGNNLLKWKVYFIFDRANYELWKADKKAQKSGLGGYIRTRFQYADRIIQGTLNKYDYQLFRAFPSFGRVDDGSVRAVPSTKQLWYIDVRPGLDSQSCYIPASEREQNLISKTRMTFQDWESARFPESWLASPYPPQDLGAWDDFFDSLFKPDPVRPLVRSAVYNPCPRSSYVDRLVKFQEKARYEQAIEMVEDLVTREILLPDRAVEILESLRDGVNPLGIIKSLQAIEAEQVQRSRLDTIIDKLERKSKKLDKERGVSSKSARVVPLNNSVPVKRFLKTQDL
jgi:hypothetical protein